MRNNNKQQEYEETKQNFKHLRNQFALISSKGLKFSEVGKGFDEFDQEHVYGYLKGPKDCDFDFEVSIRQVHKDTKQNGKNTN
jgi:predicted patatin/cPLA2 family phospholipase|tara:strand:+ start:418 stop:666 length:249 start_codon:yes stop_codon:yes gene_type:complete